MERCYYSRKKQFLYFLFCLMGCGMGVFLIGLSCAVLIIDYSTDLWAPCALVFFLGAGLIGNCIFTYAVMSKEWMVDPEGITLRYLKRKTVKYSWDAVVSILVCDVHHAPKNPDEHSIVIRISFREEKSGPFSKHCPVTISGFERWRTSEYHLLHFRDVVFLEYSPVREKQIAEYSAKKIQYSMTRYGKIDLNDTQIK